MRPNWFIAFPVEGSFVAELPKAPSKVRLFKSLDVHLTLSFLGPVSDERAQLAFHALKKRLAVEPLHVTDVSLGAVVPMGRPSQYTALSALLERGRTTFESAILRYRPLISEAAEIAQDKRPPKPHITLARPWQRATPTERELGRLWAEKLDLRAIERRLDRVALYTWNSARHEQLFQIVADQKLPLSDS
jgi:RNA 2',3'-cyclic 3'-phosphodiesterase